MCLIKPIRTIDLFVISIAFFKKKNAWALYCVYLINQFQLAISSLIGLSDWSFIIDNQRWLWQDLLGPLTATPILTAIWLYWCFVYVLWTTESRFRCWSHTVAMCWTTATATTKATKENRLFIYNMVFVCRFLVEGSTMIFCCWICCFTFCTAMSNGDFNVLWKLINIKHLNSFKTIKNHPNYCRLQFQKWQLTFRADRLLDWK